MFPIWSIFKGIAIVNLCWALTLSTWSPKWLVDTLGWSGNRIWAWSLWLLHLELHPWFYVLCHFMKWQKWIWESSFCTQISICSCYDTSRGKQSLDTAEQRCNTSRSCKMHSEIRNRYFGCSSISQWRISKPWHRGEAVQLRGERRYQESNQPNFSEHT